MVLKLVKRAVGVGTLLFLLANPADLSSCGPFFPEEVFTRPQTPDNEQAFFHGRLGILQPSYERRYLAIAYRILKDEPLSDSQVASVSDLERFRMSDSQSAVDQWLAARKAVPETAAVKIDRYRSGSNFTMYSACGDDAFDTARRTLLDLIRQVGANSGEVRDWLTAQDTVFDSCGAGSKLPDPPAASSSVRVRTARQYQIAAALFYSGRHDQARAAFLQIAADDASPWHVIAPYLVARTYLRQDRYADAEQQLKAILADPRESGVHQPAGQLLDYALAHSDPAARLLAISKELMQPDSPRLGTDLNDYTFLFDKLGDAIRPLTAEDGLTDWIVDFQNVWAGKRPRAASARWPQRDSLPWLLEELQWSSGGQPEAQQLIDAAAAIPIESPAYATARFQAARLLIEADRKAQAAALLDAVFRNARETSLDLSTVNAFRAERMKAAANFDEVLRYAPRTEVAEVTEGLSDNTIAKADAEPMLDMDAATLFNRWLPLSLWLRAVHSDQLAQQLRTELAQSAWVRTVMLGTAGQDLARALIKDKPSYATGLEPYFSAPDPSTRTFEAAFFILHHPEMQPMLRSGLQRGTPDGRIDDFRDNWWEPPVRPVLPPLDDAAYPPFGFTSPILKQLYPGGQVPAPDFLSSQEADRASTERKALQAAGSAPKFLSSIVVSWAKSHPSDTRNAEALALSVKTSRFAPSDPNSAGPVEEAFRLLHDRYPNTAWARQTPYWYK